MLASLSLRIGQLHFGCCVTRYADVRLRDLDADQGLADCIGYRGNSAQRCVQAHGFQAMPKKVNDGLGRHLKKLEQSTHLVADTTVGENTPTMMEQRLEDAGLDIGYLREAQPSAYQRMRQVCSSCPNPDRCLRDLERGDWEAGQRRYCPNAPAIDLLIVTRS